MPPKAKAKGVAAKAKAKAAAVGRCLVTPQHGKAKARAKDLGWGRRAGPKDTLLPPGPPPVTTRRWVHFLWPPRDRAGMPPKAKAKGRAAQATADAAAAGKVKAQARGLDKGKGALPQGALQPSRPPPVATRRWVRCGWDADYYDNEAALAAPGELIEAVIQDAKAPPEGACWSK